MKKQTIRRVPAISISGTDYPKLPKATPLQQTERKNFDPASAGRVENYPIPAFFEYRTIGVDRYRV